MKRPSRSSVRQRAAALREERQAPAALPELLEAKLVAYVPRLGTDVWGAIKATHNDIMRRSSIRGEMSFGLRCRELARYLAWRHQQGASVAISDAMTFTAIDDYYMRGMGRFKPASRNDGRSRLRRLALDSNPSLDTPPAAVPVGKVPIKPPYDAREEASIKRVVIKYKNPRTRRNLCGIVGLCGGAGLGSTDLKELRCRHVIDMGDKGIVVEIPGDKARIVWVRRSYEELVREATRDRRPGDLVVGEKTSRKNITGNIVAAANILGDVPHIEASRLRTTWLGWLMTREVPIQVILTAAGLKSARTLIEIVPHLRETQPSDAHLRGEEPTT